MTVVEKTKLQQAELHKKLWAIANDLRGNMEASEFKNYILSLIFYKYLSEKIEKVANRMLEDDNLTYSDGWKDSQMQDILKEELMRAIGYIIEPQYMFSELIKEIKKGIIILVLRIWLYFLLLRESKYAIAVMAIK